MTKRCLGFYFSEDRERVLLKKNPEGFFDGVGCKVGQERERHALIMEFYHSTGIDTYLYDWNFLRSIDGTYIFYSFGDVHDAVATEDPTQVFEVHNLENFQVADDAKRYVREILERVMEPA